MKTAHHLPANVAVIGYGYAGRAFHSYLVGLTPSLRLHSIVTSDPERQKRARKDHACQVHGSFEKAIEDPEVDLVVLATPNHVHCDLAVRALDAGKHVVTDKPMCLNLAECDAMIAAAERNDALLAVFQNRRWDGDFLTLQKLISDGDLGSLRWLEMAWQGQRACRNWRGQAAMGGGRLFDLGSHLLDQILLVMPQPVTSVYCRMHHDDPGTDTESHAMLVLGFEDGATAVVDNSSMNWISKPRFYACGEKAAFLKYGLDPQEKAMNEGRIDEAEESAEFYGTLRGEDGEKRIPTLPGRWRNYYEMIGDTLAGKVPATGIVRLEQSRRVIAVLDAALQSAKSGEVIKTHITL